MSEPLYITWDSKDSQSKERALAAAAGVREKTVARTTYTGMGPPNTSVRDGFSRRDYDFFRPGERMPVKDSEILCACNDIYEGNGIVHNIVDMMADFICKGIDLDHRQPGIELLYKEWWRQIRAKERTERICNSLLKLGIAPIRRNNAKLDNASIRDYLRAQAEELDETLPEPPYEVPWDYTILNPLTLEVLGGELALLVGRSLDYGLKLDPKLIRKVKSGKFSPKEKELLSYLPNDLVDAIRAGEKVYPLPPEEMVVLHYKKDDWQLWARPMLHCILQDVRRYEKMKLMDLAAVDGAISHIRIWKLGSLDHEMIPNQRAIDKLTDVLINNVGGGCLDLVWGPELQLEETSTEVHKFLGEEKYRPVLNDIFTGLGVPPTLAGSGASAQGFTNNWISLRTLIERLEYVRDAVKAFWEGEIRRFQLAMGLRYPAQLVFDQQTLSDEVAEKRLLIDLIDRGIISEEVVQERFGVIPEIERGRRIREAKQRESGELPPKPGPFSPLEKFELTKLFAQRGVVTPSEVGLELKDKKPGEVAPVELEAKLAPKPASTVKGKPGKGRPAGKKDATKRKKKRVTPRTAATLSEHILYYDQARKKISSWLQPAFLKAKKRKNLRELTDEEAGDFERLTFAALCQVDPNQTLDEKSLQDLLRSNLFVPIQIEQLTRQVKARWEETSQEPWTLERARLTECQATALFHLSLPENAV